MTSKEAIQELWKLRSCSFKVYQKHKDWQKEIEKYDKIGEVLDVIQKDLDRLETLELNLDSEKYHLFNENQSLKNRVEDLEICFKVRVKENEKLKKFALHFKSDIQEGLKGNYRRGENIVYDNLLNEFGKSFLNDLLKEVLEND